MQTLRKLPISSPNSPASRDQSREGSPRESATERLPVGGERRRSHVLHGESLLHFRPRFPPQLVASSRIEPAQSLRDHTNVVRHENSVHAVFYQLRNPSRT